MSKVLAAEDKSLTPAANGKAGRGFGQQTLWLAGLVTLVTLVLAIGPGLVRSNKLPLPVLNNLQKPVRLEGFYPTEANSTATFRWTGSTARIYLPESLTPQSVTLEVAAAYPAGVSPPRLHLRYNGQEIDSWPVGNSWTRFEAKFPASLNLATQPLDFEIENPLAPRKGDNRTLGVAVRSVDLEVSRVASLSVILLSLVIGLGLLLIGRWLGFGVGQVLLVSVGPVLLLSLYWQVERFYGSVLVGGVALLAGLATLVWLYPLVFFPVVPFSRTRGYIFKGGFLDEWSEGQGDPAPTTLSRLLRSAINLRSYPKFLVWLPPMLIIGFVFVEYGRALDFGFFWDDYHIARPWTVGEVAGTFAGSWDSLGLEPSYFRPLAVVSFGLDWGLWGYEPFGYHLMNLLLHSGAALLLYVLLRRLRLNWLPSLAGALLFVVLPPNVATAEWISQRSDSLSAVFMLCGLLAFAAFRNSFKIRWLVGANVALVLALCSKEIAIILPLLFLILPQMQQKEVLEKGQGNPAPTNGFSLPENQINFFKNFLKDFLGRNWKTWIISFGPSFLIVGLYLGWRSVVLPTGLTDTSKPLNLETLWNGYYSAVYQTFYGLDNWLGEQAAPWFTLTLLVLTGLLLLFRSKAKSWRVFGFGLGWIMIACAPLALLGASYGVTARVLYLPEAGYAIGAAAVLGLLLRFAGYSRGGWRFWPVVLLIAFLLIAPYNPLHAANQRAQKDYAPTSFNTLRWDEWIYNNPAWKGKIPERHFKTIEQKLKDAGKL